MRHAKKDFQIVFNDHNKFIVQVRKPFWKFFYTWVTVTYQEAEHTEDMELIFDTFEAATNFIDLVAN